MVGQLAGQDLGSAAVMLVLAIVVLLVGISPLFCWLALGRIEKRLKRVSDQLDLVNVGLRQSRQAASPAGVPATLDGPTRWRVVGTTADGRRGAITVVAFSATEAREKAHAKLTDVENVRAEA